MYLATAKGFRTQLARELTAPASGQITPPTWRPPTAFTIRACFDDGAIVLGCQVDQLPSPTCRAFRIKVTTIESKGGQGGSRAPKRGREGIQTGADRPWS